MQQGGGFIGIDEPAAVNANGHFFQLYDVLGVEKDLGWQMEWNLPILAAARSKNDIIPPLVVSTDHFIPNEAGKAFAPEQVESWVSPLPLGKHTDNLQVLAAYGQHILASTNRYGRGRAVYLARASFSWELARLLHLSILWVGKREAEVKKCFSANHLVECAYYPATGALMAVNNSGQTQAGAIYDHKGRAHQMRIAPYASAWKELKR